jgi:hypothetical protein
MAEWSLTRRCAVWGAALGALCGVIAIVVIVTARQENALGPFAGLLIGIAVLSAVKIGQSIFPGSSGAAIAVGFASWPFCGMVVGGIAGRTIGWIWTELRRAP